MRRSTEAVATAIAGQPPAHERRRRRTRGLGVTLCLGLLVAAAASPAAADAGDASAVAARVSLTGTVVGTEINVLDETLSEAAVSQGDEDQEVTDTLLDLDLGVLGLEVSGAVISSTASSDFVAAEASSLLTDVGVELDLLDLVDLPQILGLDTVSTNAFCPVFGEPQASVDPPATVILLGQEVDVVLDQDIEVVIPLLASAVLRISQTDVTSDSAEAVGLELAVNVNVIGLVALDLEVVISESTCERGLSETDIFAPAALEVDYQELVSDGNGVFEPGETVDVAPTWHNTSDNLSAAFGDASNFTGPAGPTYSIDAADADYGIVDADSDASCRATGVCYQMQAGPSGVERPAQHWDTTFDEDMSDGSSRTWTLHIGDSFLDNPRVSPFYAFIETIWHHGITLGCNSTDYCPGAPNARQQMATFVLRSIEGNDYSPPPCDAGNPVFADVPASSPFCPFVEELAARGVASGCGGDNFCPAAPITRAQMATFLLRGLEGGAYTPPGTCANVFVDVPCSSTFALWIEDLFARGVTSGCDDPAGGYCPAEPVTRQQMAVFLTRTFGLQLYGL